MKHSPIYILPSLNFVLNVSAPSTYALCLYTCEMIFYCMRASEWVCVFFCENMRKLVGSMVWRWHWSTVECTVNAVKILNEINNSINIMSATSFDEKCKALNAKPGWIFLHLCALGARIHVIIHGIEYSGDEFLNEPHIFLVSPRSPSPFSHSMYRTLYFTIPQLDSIQHLCLRCWKMNKLPLCEWGNAANTRNLPWSEFDSQIEWL